MSESRRVLIRVRVYTKANYEIGRQVRHEIVEHVRNQTLSRKYRVELSTRWYVEGQIWEEAQR